MMVNAAPAAQPLVQVEGISKTFGARRVLDNVSLSIGAGETVALIGPSGGGKSTLLRCLNGLNTFDSGEIRVAGHTLGPTPSGRRASRSATTPVRRVLGMVFQDFQLFPHLSVLANVIEAPMRVLGLDRAAATARAIPLLERVGLGDRGAALPRELSGGQKQRVAIARALAMQPRGLLCDEITSALDPELKQEVLETLGDLRREGMTLIVVTHEIGFARQAADRVCVLAGGTIIEEGPPQQVIDDPQNPRTRQFLAHVLA